MLSNQLFLRCLLKYIYERLISVFTCTQSFVWDAYGLKWTTVWKRGIGRYDATAWCKALAIIAVVVAEPIAKGLLQFFTVSCIRILCYTCSTCEWEILYISLLKSPDIVFIQSHMKYYNVDNICNVLRGYIQYIVYYTLVENISYEWKGWRQNKACVWRKKKWIFHRVVSIKSSTHNTPTFHSFILFQLATLKSQHDFSPTYEQREK